ncbi:MAG: uracil phosphoribosyltransferase [Fimbriimonadaceae bacterium]|nr:uracil phosphoribosyltransferase [Fimbriimonadaceae bacterium]
MGLFVCEHPLARHLLTQLRDVNTSPERFRNSARLLSDLLLLEATTDLRIRDIEVQTPLETVRDAALDQGLAVVPVLRAGLSMLESALQLFPDVAVGYIGLERNENTAIAHSYYCKLPKLPGRLTLCLDPMLATGGSAAQAIHVLKANGADQIKMVSVIAAPEGVARLQEAHPEVPIFTAALDRELNDKKYIMPGLGDFGDRLYGTL